MHPKLLSISFRHIIVKVYIWPRAAFSVLRDDAKCGEKEQ